jgi:hypothetical protein
MDNVKYGDTDGAMLLTILEDGTPRDLSGITVDVILNNARTSTRVEKTDLQHGDDPGTALLTMTDSDYETLSPDGRSETIQVQITMTRTEGQRTAPTRSFDTFIIFPRLSDS